tara:strand:+ start:1178 stop:1471 length:294 start_codon:yes stop_codon:yes gene_type:complete
MNRLDIFKLSTVFLIEFFIVFVVVSCYQTTDHIAVRILIASAIITELLRLNISLFIIESFERTQKYNERFSIVEKVLGVLTSIIVTITVIVTLIIIS